MKQYKEAYKKLIQQYLKNYVPNYIDFLKKRYQDYKYICGFGVGNMGIRVPEIVGLLGRNVDFYCDNNPHKTGKKDPYGFGIDVISLEELVKCKDDTAILVPTRYYKEIYAQLKELGFPLIDRVFYGKTIIDEYLEQHDREQTIQNLFDVIDVFADEESCRILTRIVQEWVTNEYTYGQIDDIYSVPQYFPEGIIKKNSQEIYIDCGAYIGDDIPNFMQFTGGEFGKYYAFELNKESYKGLQHNIEKNWNQYADRFVLENKGVSDCTERIMYAERGEGSKMSQDGTVEGEVVALDDYFEADSIVNSIKMDIEGAEMQAIIGAYKTISRNLPKLAICVYHKPEDLWEIPLYIKNNWDEYNIYIRHHTDLLNETVCYAVRKDYL